MIQYKLVYSAGVDMFLESAKLMYSLYASIHLDVMCPHLQRRMRVRPQVQYPAVKGEVKLS